MLDTLLVSFVLLLIKLVSSVFRLLSLYYYFKKPQKCPPITDKRLLYSARTITKMVARKEITSEQLIKTYISRINNVNPIINAVVQNRFELALNEAKVVDNIIKTSNLTPDELLQNYPLLGLPLSIKESIAVSGCSNAAGKVFKGGRLATKDAYIVELCKNAGAIPLVLTNTPELSANFETDNNITGRTSNPYDSRKTVGGSSGGEGALLGAGASLIGLGSDIYGSLRLPAHFCGVWGHKPSSRTVSIDGHYPLSKHLEEWKELFILGPMTRYAGDLSLILDVILQKDFRSKLKLNEEVDLTTIKFYYIKDRISVLTNPLHKDVDKFIQKLVQYLNFTYPQSVKKLNGDIFKTAPESSIVVVCSHDDVEGVFENKGKSWFTDLIQYLTGQSSSSLIIVFLHLIKRLISILPSWSIKKYKNNISALKNELIQILGSDGVLFVPCNPSPAHYHNQMFSQLFDYSLMGIFNCLGLPVTNCPLGLNEQGLPIGIQVVAGPNNDRLTLAVAEEIEKVFGGWIPPS